LDARTQELQEFLENGLGHAYTLERELGGGGMAHVFLAVETRLERRVVIKVLLTDLAAGISADRFEREIRVAARLQHPNIVPLLTAGDLGGLPYYTMPFIEGESLRTRLSWGPVLVDEGVSILRDVARALAYAHRQGIVHRDIKPDNVLLSDDAALVSDFGVARAVSAATTATRGNTLTQVGMAIGTPAYMSPEQAAGDPHVDHRADLYALGVMAYEVFSGVHPFAGRHTPQEVMSAHLTEVPQAIGSRAANLPPALAEIVMRCLAKRPSDRPESAHEILEVLGARYVLPSGERDPSIVASPTPGGTVDLRPTVAVLPFTNLSSDPENEYLSDGIADEIIGTLGRSRMVRVAGRASSFALKGQQLDPQSVGERLRVNAVVEGSVRRAGNRVRVSAALVDAADGFQRWSERYDRDVTDIFSVQDEIAHSIADALSTRLLTPPEVGSAPPQAPACCDPEAYRVYLLARHMLRTQVTPQGYQRAMELLDRALALDPQLARAHATRAVAFNNLAVYSLGVPKAVFPHARDAARAALAIDSGIAEAQAILAQITYAFEGDWKTAATIFERALAAHPDDSGTLIRAALFHAASRRSGVHHDDAALRLTRRALELEPLAAWERFMAGTVRWLLRRYDDAEVILRESIDLNPHHGLSVMQLGLVVREQGNVDEAIPLLERALALTGRNPLVLANMAIAHAKHGDATRATACIAEMIQRSSSERVSPVYIGEALGWLGRLDEAFTYLARSVEDRDFWLVMLGADPCADALREDPRLADVMRVVGIPSSGE
jgi:serine/threonine-protein kinase